MILPTNVLDESCRLAILRFLNENGDSLNTSVLRDALEAIGFAVSRDRVETLVAWLVEMGLATVRDVGSVRVVALTGRGDDVAAGRVRVPGVKRPSPGA